MREIEETLKRAQALAAHNLRVRHLAQEAIMRYRAGEYTLAHAYAVMALSCAREAA